MITAKGNIHEIRFIMKVYFNFFIKIFKIYFGPFLYFVSTVLVAVGHQFSSRFFSFHPAKKHSCRDGNHSHELENCDPQHS